MQPRSLSSFTSLVLVCGLAVACSGGEGSSTESTGETTGGTTTGTPEPTTTGSTGSTGDTPTTGPATTTGDGDSGTGSTGATSLDSTGAVDTTTFGSTGDTTGASTGIDTTTGESTTGGSTTGESTGGDPVSFAECQDGMAASCPAMDAACLVVDGPGGFWPEGSFFVQWTYCTRECETDEDCVSGLEGGSAKPVCLPKGANDIKVCVLDCSFGKTCPDGLQCSNDDSCGTKFCDCEGSGCDDFLCKE